METRPPLRHRAARVLLAAGLGLAVLGAVPWPAAAADESPSPSADPSATPSPSPTPEPTASPTPSPTPTPTPTPKPVIIRPRPVPQPSPVITSVNLYRSSAMVRQYTNYWCVPAATQSMVNLVRNTSNRSYATQKFYYKQTRQHNRYSYATLGNDPQGWAWALRYFSHGAPYTAKAYTSKSVAIDAIAASIARTGDPVGVTVHGGTHAWVVLGYRSSHNPADPSKRTVLGLYVSGPLGTSNDKWPYRYLTVNDFKGHFTRYHEWQRSVIWEGTWVVVAQ